MKTEMKKKYIFIYILLAILFASSVVVAIVFLVQNYSAGLASTASYLPPNSTVSKSPTTMFDGEQTITLFDGEGTTTLFDGELKLNESSPQITLANRIQLYHTKILLRRSSHR